MQTQFSIPFTAYSSQMIWTGCAHFYCIRNPHPPPPPRLHTFAGWLVLTFCFCASLSCYLHPVELVWFSHIRYDPPCGELSWEYTTKEGDVRIGVSYNTLERRGISVRRGFRLYTKMMFSVLFVIGMGIDWKWKKNMVLGFVTCNIYLWMKNEYNIQHNGLASKCNL